MPKTNDFEWVQYWLDWFGWWILAPLFMFILFLGMLWILAVMGDQFLEWRDTRYHSRKYNREHR